MLGSSSRVLEDSSPCNQAKLNRFGLVGGFIAGLERFKRETRARTALDHSGIVMAHSVEKTGLSEIGQSGDIPIFRVFANWECRRRAVPIGKLRFINS